MKLAQALTNTPEVLSIEVTTRCNLNCIYCNKKNRPPESLDISEDLLKKIKKEESKFSKFIICGIGESFLYPRIYEIVKEFHNQKFCIVTNGTILIDYERLNQNNNIERIIFSIDAVDRDRINQISPNYNFEHLIENLREHARYTLHSKKRIHLVLNCTLNEHNKAEMLDLIDFASEFKFNTIHFSLPRGKEAYIEENQEELKLILSMAEKRAAKAGIYFVNPFETCCIYLKWITPYISIDGDIFACAETLYINEKLGSLNNITFDNVWKTSAYQEFISGIKCKQCKFLSNCDMQFTN
ncbi:radical SAM protein [Lachnoclostridium phytofermentans]|uniref:radical SAM protein n=1 Tax=Lachnoclostridium phytofermentans TaxID=66219 RepID=UPI000495D294|nr:radical SAM protein [Lachnoclostridium phytofermentans]